MMWNSDWTSVRREPMRYQREAVPHWSKRVRSLGMKRRGSFRGKPILWHSGMKSKSRGYPDAPTCTPRSVFRAKILRSRPWVISGFPVTGLWRAWVTGDATEFSRLADPSGYPLGICEAGETLNQPIAFRSSWT